jgi:hypothetical protein
MRPKKEIPQKIRPLKGDTEIAQKIADHLGISLIDVMSQALHGGLLAVQKNNYDLPLPLDLKVINPGEASAGKRSRKMKSCDEPDAAKKAKPFESHSQNRHTENR